jgi:hypothetical protein
MAILMRVSMGIRVAAGSLLFFLAVAAPSALLAAEPVEYAVKAAYLTKFGIYVEWPDMAPGTALNLCVVGEDPFGKTLDSAASGQQPGNRPLAVKRLKEITPESGCHIAYFSNAYPATLQAIDALRGHPVLTVSDSAGKGAVINFVLRENRVRFEIDEAAAEQNSLVLSAKLLGLALNVKPRQ